VATPAKKIDPEIRELPHPGWRHARVTPSLAEVYRSVPVARGTWWRKVLAFAGPGYLVAVGYMDPGNWATDLAGGSQFGYTLLSVILMSNLMAILLQGLASKLGIVTGRDLAQACRDHYSKPVVYFLWVICELAIAACDLAEVIGSAIALNLLFNIPIPIGIGITALDVLLVLYLQNKGLAVKSVGGTDLMFPNGNPAGTGPFTGAAYVLISHGESGGGAYLDTGQPFAGTTTDGTEEQKNYPSLGLQAYYVDDQPTDVAGAAHFDDVVVRPSVLSVATKAGLGPRSH